MLDFGESFRTSWLILIQLFALLLFLAFLFCFTIIADDSPSTLHSTHVVTLSTTNPLQITRVENLSIKREIPTNTNTEIVTVREEISEGEASSLYFFHPCYYFKLVKVAFLKCFGLDFESDIPSIQKHRGEKKES
ncbi:hypothetical protein KIW84_071395 [Lathyrus oleraceus]|uniref:Transmembrane protein n=1 Tax=Pisum sativum TaxID=3888 RepID=A0A9D4VJE5_PEA|nr:hypothetical protein KIW84_071395 [Pisum sativum]